MEQARLIPRGPAHVDLRESEWVGEVLAPLWRFLRRMGCDRELAEDLAHDACLAALESGAHRRDADAAVGWLHATARNMFRAHLRAAGRRPRRLADVDEWPAPVQTDDGYRPALRRCLLQLAPRSRQAIEMRYGDNASREAIALALGIRPAGVKALLRRTREQLRICVEKRRDDET